MPDQTNIMYQPMQEDHLPQKSSPYPGTTPLGNFPPPEPTFQPAYPNENSSVPIVEHTGMVIHGGEDGEVKGLDFNEKSIRRGFIRKVYAILMCQLMVTLTAVTLFTFQEDTKLWVMMNPNVLWIAIWVLIISLVSMTCFVEVRRKTPWNFIFLGGFTLAQSFVLGVISSMYESDVVMMAVGITAALCLALTIFAMQTKYDFTMMGGALVCLLFALILFGLITIFIPKNNILSLVYACAGALLFAMYLVYDTQLMIGGNHKYTISPEEYVFAALNLYLDVVNLFLYILRILGAARR